MAEHTSKKERTIESPRSARQQSATDQNEAAESTKGRAVNEPSADDAPVEEEEDAVAPEERGEGEQSDAEHDDAQQQRQQQEDDDDAAAADIAPSSPTKGAGESGRSKSPRPVKRPMEYALSAMYPQMGVLVGHKRTKWDFGDPDVIRALWLEAKTNALAEWKVGNAVVAKRTKPLIEVQANAAFKLRRQHLETRKERLLGERLKAERMAHHRDPDFSELRLATNSTTQMRYNYTRNNPPVPSYFVAHYERFKRPPFYTFGIGSGGCRLGDRLDRS